MVYLRMHGEWLPLRHGHPDFIMEIGVLEPSAQERSKS